MAIDREKTLQAADKLAEKKKWDKAVQEYQKLIQLDPNDARVLEKLARAQAESGSIPDALATYDRVGRQYSVHPTTARKAINVFLQMRSMIAQRAPHLEDHYAHVPLRLADCYIVSGLPSDAVATLDEVVGKLMKLRRDAQALEILRKMVSIDPSNPLPHLKLGEGLIRSGDQEAGLAEFSMAAAQLVRLGYRDHALKVLERLLGLKVDAAQARIAAQLYIERNGPGDGIQAITKLQICLQANARDLEALDLLAKAFVAIGHGSKGTEVRKEMARIARAEGRLPLFHELVADLKRHVPYDEDVLELEREMLASAASAEGPPPSLASPAARSLPPDEVYEENAPEEELADVRDSDIEELDDSALEPVEEIAQDTTARKPSHEPSEVVEDEGLALSTALAVADEQRSGGRTDLAVDTLFGFLALRPNIIDARLRVAEFLIELERTQEAVSELLEAASLQLEILDADGAIASLETVLIFDPDNSGARETLAELQGRRSIEPAEPEERLPAYPLDDADSEVTGVDAAEHVSVDAIELAPPFAGSSVASADEPFGASSVDAHPSDPGLRTRVDARADASPPLAYAPLEADDAFFEAKTQAARSRESVERSGAGHGSSSLEDALEEADFFASRGLVADARAILQEQLSLHPGNLLVRERMQELEALETAHQSSGTRSLPRQAEEDRAFDIAASLDALESLAADPDTATSGMAPTQQVDAEEVFMKFKEGVSKQISVDDAQTRYDLGVAYKEMGLRDDAIREFGYAARDPARAANCEWMVGALYMEMGNVPAAIDAFLRGLDAPQKSEDDEVVLLFDLGVAYEARKMTKDALVCYQRVARVEPEYRDVKERIRKLTRTDSVRPVRAAAVGADDEFDRAFDDLLKES